MLSMVLIPDQARGSELCDQARPERLSMCASLLNADTASRALYRFTRNETGLPPANTYDFSNPEDVTGISELSGEVSKYNVELSRLFQALQNYTMTLRYLTREQSNLQFKTFVENLRAKLRNARNTVDDLGDALVMMTDSQTSSSSSTTSSSSSTSSSTPTTASTETTTTATTTAPTSTPSPSTSTSETNLLSTNSIQARANIVSDKLRRLLHLWANKCSSCGGFRRKRSLLLSRMSE